MITDNLKKWHAALFLRSYNAKSDTDLSMTDTSGSEFNLRLDSDSIGNNYWGYDLVNQSQNYGIHVGSGTTPPTPQDYNLESKIPSRSVTLSNQTRDSSCENGIFKRETTFTVTNRGSSELTVSEVGLINQTESTTNQTKYVLIDRTLLDSPATIPAGETATITYTITYTVASA